MLRNVFLLIAVLTWASPAYAHGAEILLFFFGGIGGAHLVLLICFFLTRRFRPAVVPLTMAFAILIFFVWGSFFQNFDIGPFYSGLASLGVLIMGPVAFFLLLRWAVGRILEHEREKMYLQHKAELELRSQG